MNKYRKILILGNNSVGLYNFRKELIEHLLIYNEVFFSLPEKEDNKEVKLLTELGAKYIQIPLSRHGLNPIEEIKTIYEYNRLVKEINPDIILTYTIKPNIYASYVGRRNKIPVIMNITGMGQTLNTGKFKSVFKKIYKSGCANATTVFFQNEYNMNFFIDNKIVEKEKTKLLPGSGVNINRFKPVEKEESNSIKFLFIGRLMRDKGIDEYLELANRIFKKYQKVEFHILGSYEEKRYKEILDKSKNVVYLGISNDVRNEIVNSDCIVHPSYHEGMSNVLLEAGAMGKPLIASNIPGCKEIIDNNKNGYLFELGNLEDFEKKIELFINKSAKDRLLMGKKSRKKVSREFNRDIVVEKYVREINNLLEKGV